MAPRGKNNGSEAEPTPAETILSRFTQREQNIMLHTIIALPGFPAGTEIDYAKVARRLGLQNPRSVSNAWSEIKKKVAQLEKDEREELGLSTDDEADTNAAKGGAAKRPRKRARTSAAAAKGAAPAPPAPATPDESALAPPPKRRRRSRVARAASPASSATAVGTTPASPADAPSPPGYGDLLPLPSPGGPQQQQLGGYAVYPSQRAAIKAHGGSLRRAAREALEAAKRVAAARAAVAATVARPAARAAADDMAEDDDEEEDKKAAGMIKLERIVEEDGREAYISGEI
ncbi:3bd20e1d-3414-41f9-9b1f-50b2ba38617d [Thermothielavioides terrestris]|uniref:3bd20e1d-3414-41f9-9b1f-50b2ba38617d n=1 Tax=Thermothielavioides terrestris TaxID=2587410 RepID=A0A446BST6_9PEZI|nr:3bd20e1d-3414-41f9-9b1f-50b2ba38617d [Thermothielavioides terrestris]